MNKLRSTPLLVFACLTLALMAQRFCAAGAATETSIEDDQTNGHRITLRSTSGGRVFEGLGALSAGASSRLLIDYPEPQRSEILDFLFKPNFGASLQHLKVEIGGDVDATCGTEPSHMRTRRDYNPNRGYEWWIMKEAVKRNPAIVLDCLEWGAPGWIGDGDMLSEDNANYMVRFLKAGRKTHGLKIRYVGIWNEMYWTPEFVKLLRRKLDAAGLKDVGIVAADSVNDWSIADKMRQDRALYDAVEIVGVHYPHFKTTPTARGLGKPIWSSEDGPWVSDFDSNTAYQSSSLARLYNRNYTDSRMTKTIVCALLSSFPGLYPIADTGILTARWPWSGYYRVPPAIWVTAHTTQFAAPGWRYMDEGCRVLPGGGSVVSLRDPKSGDWSAIIETQDATNNQTVAFVLREGLQAGAIHVWKSTRSEQFVRQPDLAISLERPLVLDLPTNVLISITTTTGQCKGSTTPPPYSVFPLPYKEDFESCQLQATPKYICDLVGAFEVVKRKDGKGKALRQVIPRRPHSWSPWYVDHHPHTYFGDTEWGTNYQFSADVLLERPGWGGIIGRVSCFAAAAIPMVGNFQVAQGYSLTYNHNGAWWLRAGDRVLGQGQLGMRVNEWHHLHLKFVGDRVIASIDDKQVADVKEGLFKFGMAGLLCDWPSVQFDNLEVKRAEKY